jgi:hypothetical protein
LFGERARRSGDGRRDRRKGRHEARDETEADHRHNNGFPH